MSLFDKITRTSAGGSARARERTPLVRLKDLAAAGTPAEFLGSETIDDVPGFVFMDWGTSEGVLTVAYPTTEGHSYSSAEWIRDFKPETRCLIEVPDKGFHSPDGPDVLDHGEPDKSERRVLWRYYAQAIGQPAPYWPWNLERRELIEAWRPRHAAVTAAAVQQPDLAPLLELGALYPPDSPTHQVLRHYYLRSAHDATGGSRLVEECLEDAAFPNLADRLVQAARAIEVPPPDDLTLDDAAIRAVFAEILDRKDSLAVEVVSRIRVWGAGKYFPFATVDRFRVGHCEMLYEWLEQLDEVPDNLADPRFGYLVSGERSVHRRLVDRATGAPVVELVDFHGEVSEYVTLLPRRLPAMTPLAELIVDQDGHSLWVRTEDRTLYPAPAGEYGVAWGYSGSVAAPLVERLLDDINTEPLDKSESPAANGLSALTRRKTPSGTVFTRAELEEARRRQSTK